jgi:hypothetical protein
MSAQNLALCKKSKGRTLPENRFAETGGKEKGRLAARVLAKRVQTRQER